MKEPTGLSHLTPEWLLKLMEDSSITDLCINGPGQVFIDRGGGNERLDLSKTVQWNDQELKNWVLEQLSMIGKSWDARYPFVDATLINEVSHYAFRLHVAFPPLSRNGTVISMRRLPRSFNHPVTGPSYSELRAGIIQRWGDSGDALPLLIDVVKKKDSILIAGSTGSGKTTLLGDLLSFVEPTERILLLEDTPELAPLHVHSISLVSRPVNPDGFGEVTLRTLLKQTLRMRPDRIILGECRGPEVLDLLQVLNTGHCGTIATVHANSGRDAIRRLELLCALATPGAISTTALKELLSTGIQWIVFVKNSSGKRKIVEINKVEGREGDAILLRPVI